MMGPARGFSLGLLMRGVPLSNTRNSVLFSEALRQLWQREGILETNSPGAIFPASVGWCWTVLMTLGRSPYGGYSMVARTINVVREALQLQRKICRVLPRFGSRWVLFRKRPFGLRRVYTVEDMPCIKVKIAVGGIAYRKASQHITTYKHNLMSFKAAPCSWTPTNMPEVQIRASRLQTEVEVQCFNPKVESKPFLAGQMSAGISDIRSTADIRRWLRLRRLRDLPGDVWRCLGWKAQVAGGVDSSLYPVAVLIDELRFGPQNRTTDRQWTDNEASTKVQKSTQEQYQVSSVSHKQDNILMKSDNRAALTCEDSQVTTGIQLVIPQEKQAVKTSPS